MLACIRKCQQDQGSDLALVRSYLEYCSEWPNAEHKKDIELFKFVHRTTKLVKEVESKDL